MSKPPAFLRPLYDQLRNRELAIAHSQVAEAKAFMSSLPEWDSGPVMLRSGTDATEYAWFVWGPHRKGMLHILPPAAYGRADWKERAA